MAVSVKDLAKWIKEEVEFLTNNEAYVGGWLQLGNGLAATILWEPGYGIEERDDIIQSKDNHDYALNAGILVYNPHDTPDGWHPLSDNEGNVVTETTAFSKSDDYSELAKWILKDFEEVKDVDYDKNGVIQDKVEVEEDKEEAMKESKKSKEELKLISMIKDDEVSVDDCMQEYLEIYTDTDVMTSFEMEDTIHDLYEGNREDVKQAKRLEKLLDKNPGVDYFDYYNEEPITDKKWLIARMEIEESKKAMKTIRTMKAIREAHEESLDFNRFTSDGYNTVTDVRGSWVETKGKNGSELSWSPHWWFLNVVSNDLEDAIRDKYGIDDFSEAMTWKGTHIYIEFNKEDEAKIEVNSFKEFLDSFLDKYREYGADFKITFVPKPRGKMGGNMYLDIMFKNYTDFDESSKFFSKLKKAIDSKNAIREAAGDDFHNSEYKDLISKHFNNSWDFEFLDVVANILDRVDDFMDEEEIYEAVDSGLIYTDDQWTVLKHYCSPDNADFNEALDEFYSDLLAIAGEIVDYYVDIKRERE